MTSRGTSIKIPRYHHHYHHHHPHPHHHHHHSSSSYSLSSPMAERTAPTYWQPRLVTMVVCLEALKSYHVLSFWANFYSESQVQRSRRKGPPRDRCEGADWTASCREKRVLGPTAWLMPSTTYTLKDGSTWN